MKGVSGLDGFFAMISRMKYIERWGLMRCTRSETLAEHTLETALLAHALIEIGNARFGKSLGPGRAVLLSLYHDSAEILTGDLPTLSLIHISFARFRNAKRQTVDLIFKRQNCG